MKEGEEEEKWSWAGGATRPLWLAYFSRSKWRRCLELAQGAIKLVQAPIESVESWANAGVRATSSRSALLVTLCNHRLDILRCVVCPVVVGIPL